MAASLSRLTLYALISSVELDMRDSLARFAAPAISSRELFGNDLLNTILARSGFEPSEIGEELKPADLLEFTDFGDLYSLLRRHDKVLPERLNDQAKGLNGSFERLIATRNRVMHARPLEFDDLARTSEMAENLLREKQFWPNLEKMVSELEGSPEQVLRLKIPAYNEPTKILHNLPLPDFDETGFIGRKTALANLVRACLGVYPVITVVGEGGLGKTSLALKAAYEILDSKDCPFEAIIFVTAKATQLTANEISRIKGAINSSLGLMEVAVAFLGGEAHDPIAELKELLRTFRILLIIDNLETVLDHHLRDVLEDLPAGSKILITTRVGLGAFEFPVKLEGLTDAEAIQLLRATADVRSTGRLASTSNDKVGAYCRRMRNNPLHIKWFVSAVQMGRRPEEVLADEKMFLKFCLSNVFDQISSEARSIVRALLALGGSYTVAELSYLTEMDEDELLKAVQELMRTNMFLMNSSHLGNTYESRYELSQLARAYLTKFYPAAKELQVKLLSLKNKLISGSEEQLNAAKRNPLSPYTIHMRGRSDWVIAKHLRDALSLAKDRDFEESLKLVEKAKILSPDFYECYRVEGWINALIGNASQAYDSYERAIETEPKAANARTMFAGFLLRDLHDADHAARELEIAMNLLPENPEPRLEYARCCLYLGRFDRAEEILASLATMTNCHERVQTKIVDLQIQIRCRKADSSANNQEPMRAIDSLESLREYFEKIQNPDQKMFDRLTRIRRSAVQARNQLVPGTQPYAKAEALLNWIDETCHTQQCARDSSIQNSELDLWERGYLARFHSSGKFGFIRTSDSEEYFFHVSSITDEALLSDRSTGIGVKFRPSVDYMNRLVAIDVQRAEPSLRPA
ncbi:Tetratricopeptide repeat-containing protein [Dyella sp. OK004]|nr:Tetratricopeptide repeat-containing protein [Dyella sp. OK004]